MTKKFSALFLFFTVIPALSVTGCEMYQESYLTEKRAYVEKGRFVREVPVSVANEEFYAGLAKSYNKYGGDGLYLTFVYDPTSSQNTAMLASRHAAVATKMLRAKGVQELKTDILPARAVGKEAKLIASFTKYAAHGPDCGTMPGLEGGGESGYNKDYKLGCSTETYLARQIARPKDLSGQKGLPETSSGRRAANMLRNRQAGVPAEPLEDTGTSIGDIE